MGAFKEQAIEQINEQEQQERERLVEALKFSYPKMYYDIEQARDHGDLQAVVNFIETLETDLEQV